jgi:hypothetical protein
MNVAEDRAPYKTKTWQETVLDDMPPLVGLPSGVSPLRIDELKAMAIDVVAYMQRRGVTPAEGGIVRRYVDEIWGRLLGSARPPI